MKCSSLELLALSVLAILLLTPGCSTRFVAPTPALCVTPPECLARCPPIPEPSDPSEAAVMRWELQLVQWGERCATTQLECAAAQSDILSRQKE
jgi:hypothetical protein